ncbi:MAG: hypothetical protein HZC01_02605 [Candidatus Kerfeldbacteria bacterium]|nr:hypothetical protein [Candidatus Kerfeldbacteria bacterium]
MKKNVLLSAIVLAAIIIVVSLILISKNNNEENSTNGNTQISNSSSSENILYIASYHIYVLLESDQRADTSSLTLVDSSSGEIRKTFSTHAPSQLHSFIWDEKSSRIYFSATSVSKEITTFFYIDLNDPDPNAITEIVYDPQSKISGTLKLIGSNNDTIYFNDGGQVYSLNVANGLSAVPTELE